MRIDNSNILMSSAHSQVKRHEKSEDLRMWTGEQGPRTPQNSHHVKDNITLTEDAKNHLKKSHDISQADEDLSTTDTDSNLLVAKLIVEALTGRKINITDLAKVSDGQDAETSEETQEAGQEVQQAQGQGWGAVYNSSESYYEYQEMSFSAEGVIKTADGLEIKFSLELKMQWEYSSQQTINIRAGDAALTDPIVINFSGAAADLSSTKFDFDIDADGDDDNISFVKPGSGLLVLDKNNDGRVNDGKELFGPQTGNGFGELAEYDEDKNNWIDENDSIFEQLRLWTKDAEGNDNLNTLIEINVGAIYLASANSTFDLKDSGNNLNGQIATTGLFLNEDGTPGTVQQVNVVA
ncbi:MAG: hypothetical protein HZB61_13890 [Nitrospirae bacterium]|nr:hypothetical protein [Nitrospirota bacterium]